MQVAEMKICDI